MTVNISVAASITLNVRPSKSMKSKPGASIQVDLKPIKARVGRVIKAWMYNKIFSSTGSDLRARLGLRLRLRLRLRERADGSCDGDTQAGHDERHQGRKQDSV